ncbi:transcription factor Adf-1-like [Macrosteles quadrilineatus]|uniref:transcription factor Adf-1-like n=1 Tax=Macrosteles quadrilineatus TaxID=74068 RepID=UPI0023E0FB69|nr:transcription factor Adf-1-like [Macrosteles quadrilineatus]
MGFRRFSHSDDLLLVNSVKSFPNLYSQEGLSVTKNHESMRENWRAVAAEVGVNESECKRRWRDIRDHYFKTKRKHEQSKDKKWAPRWSLYESLHFLARAKRKKRHSSCEDLSDPSAENSLDIYEPEMTVKVEEDSQTDLQLRSEFIDVKTPQQEADTSYRKPSECGSVHFLEEPDPSWAPRTLVNAYSNQRVDSEDDIDIFMRSVALTVKRLSPKARAEAKMRILSVVTELEFPPNNHGEV